MTAKYLEIKVVLEPTLMQGVDFLARVEGVSDSEMLRDLIKESIKVLEFDHVQKTADHRRIIYSRKRSSPHYEFRRDGTL